MTMTLTERADEGMRRIQAGESLRDVLCDMYTAGLMGKTPVQGYIMADGVIRSVVDFDDDLAFAKANGDRYVFRFQQRMEDGKNDAACCMMWHSFLEAAGADDDAAWTTEELRDAVYTALKHAGSALAEDGREPLDVSGDARAVLAMALYVAGHLGETEAVNPDTTIEQTATLICSLAADNEAPHALAAVTLLRLAHFAPGTDAQPLGQLMRAAARTGA